jgi:hypothetical protein
VSTPQTVYRAFPETSPHPARSRRYTAEEFSATPKQKVQVAPPSYAGHHSTTIWYVEQPRCYIVEVSFTIRSPVYIQSIFTFTPTMGMDRVDGELAQDAEECILHETLGFETHRLDAYPPTSVIPAIPYLRSKGFVK